MKVLHQRQRIDTAGTALFVAFDPPSRLQPTLLDGVELTYPLLVDSERTVYRAWGLGRGSVLGIWADPRVFVIDPEGIVAYSRPQRRDDRPPVADLLRALEQAAG